MARPPRRPTGGKSRFSEAPGRPGPGRDRGRGKPEAARRPRPQADDLIRITGLPAVAAAFERDPGRVERLFFDERTAGRVGPWSQVMAAARRPYRLVGAEELAKIAGTALHGGVVAVCRPRGVLPFDPAEAAGWAREGKPLVILDGIGNPHNLGAIVRTMAFFGLERLVISDHPGQAGPSESAHRVAEGGLEWVTLYRAEKLHGLLPALKPAWRVVGTALREGPSPTLAELRRGPRPAAIVLGNEEHGLPRETQRACEDLLTLPGSGRVQSLNVAATAAILMHGLTADG